MNLCGAIVRFNINIIDMQIRFKSKLVMNNVRARVLRHEWKLAWNDYAYDLSVSKDPEEK